MFAPLSKEFYAFKQLCPEARAVRRGTPGSALIEEAQKVILSPSSENYLKRPFLVTTQNQRYLEQTGAFRAKRAFCILGGGDTVISLSAAGVYSITAIDINEFQLPIVSLKEAALNSLEHREMESFIYDATDKDFLSYDLQFAK